MFEFPVKVYYEDTDAGGVVYYANYLRFLERARSEWLLHLGFEQRRLAENARIGFIVRRLALSYRAPARLEDQLLVRTWPISLGRAGMLLGQEVVFADDKTQAVSGEVDIACVDLQSLRPTRLPAEILAAVRPVLAQADGQA